jgi:trans-AT polyketide synthase/acyltransferase/oxidoreductase domain-containing protein
MQITPEMLGSPEFRTDHGVRYAYVAGAMVKGIASTALVVRMAKARLLSYYGSAGQRLEVVEKALAQIAAELRPDEPYGVNLIHNMQLPEYEQRTVDLFLRHAVREVEAAAYIHITPALVRYRLKGVHCRPSGEIVTPHRLLGKASRPEVAERFLSPPPPEIVRGLLQAGQISAEEARLAPFLSMADDVCAEADSAGHTDRRPLIVLLPAFVRLRDRLCGMGGGRRMRVGAAGGLGAPEAIAAAFLMGADFVLTGSINQCTVEAGTSDRAKDLLAAAEIQDTDMTPASDMFEIGAKVQVLKKGVLFPGRANRLYELYQRYGSLDEIDVKTLETIQKKYFKRSIDDVWAETRRYYEAAAPQELEKAERNPKHKMAMVFRWYLIQSARLAQAGQEGSEDYQIHCGPAMGAFNQWVKGTRFEDWRNRHVDEIGEALLRAAAQILTSSFASLSALRQSSSEVHS